MEIITLQVEAKGEIITNNLPEFRECIKLALSTVNKNLITDEDFGQAVLDVTKLKEMEDAVRLASLQAFDDKIKAMQAELNETAEEIRAPRLELEKLIAHRKEQVKKEIIDEALQDLVCDSRHRQSVFGRNVADSLKGKKLLESMKKAVGQAVAIHNSCILRNREVIASFCEEHGEDLVLDAGDLEVKSLDLVSSELRRRLEARKALVEKQKLAEAAAKATAEAKEATEKLAASKEEPKVELPKPPVRDTKFELAAEITPSEEWTIFQTEVFKMFAQLKGEGEKMIHLENIEKLNAFGASINKAWKEIK